MRAALLPLALLPLVLLAGCDNAKVEVGDDTASMSDTAPDGDADTDADSDTDTDADTDSDTDTDVETSTLTFLVDGETDADALQLDWLTGEFAIFGRLGGAAVAGGTVTIELATPGPADLQEITNGLWGRYALPYVFVDDGDRTHEGEEIRGVGLVWVLYLTGNIPAEYRALGVVDGWNALRFVEGELPVVYDTDAIPLSVNLGSFAEADIGGTVGVELGENPRLMVLPSVAFEGRPYGSLIYDQGLEDTWSVHAAGAPPDLHLVDVSGNGLYGAIEVPIAFDDADDDHFPTEAELIGPSCAGTDLAALLWIAPPTDPLIAYYLVLQGVTPGWYPVAGDEMGFLAPDLATSLVLGGGCGFE